MSPTAGPVQANEQNDTGVPVVFDEAAIRHTVRFRKVSNRYPRRVAEAYGGDLARAAGDSDEQIAATVAAWELAHGLEPRDWHAIGIAEGR